jgi:hypothetical protein
MSKSIPKPKSCGPQLSADEPQPTWSIDECGLYAQRQNSEIQNNESGLTAHYWWLGCALTFARTNVKHGAWNAFLDEWRINKTRSSKAIAIHRTFPNIADIGELTVEEAYARRERKIVKRKGKSSKPRKGIIDWCQETSQYIVNWREESKYSVEEEVSAWLVELQAVMQGLEGLREQLAQTHNSKNIA